MLEKLDRFSEALQKRNPDDHLIRFFNDVYDESEANERYMADLEYTQLTQQLHFNSTMQLLADCRRLRVGVIRNIKQIRKNNA